MKTDTKLTDQKLALFDTNIFIYIAQGKLTTQVVNNVLVGYSPINKIEALGYGALPMFESNLMTQLFDECINLELNEKVSEKAIWLRQQHSIKLADAIIAATAIVHGAILYTANTDDFKIIEGLELHNPLSSS